MQQLSDDQVRDLIVDRRAEEDDPLIEQTAIDVKRALPTGGLLDHHRYEWAHDPRFFRVLRWIPADCSNRVTAAPKGSRQRSFPAPRSALAALRCPLCRASRASREPSPDRR